MEIPYPITSWSTCVELQQRNQPLNIEEKAKRTRIKENGSAVLRVAECITGRYSDDRYGSFRTAEIGVVERDLASMSETELSHAAEHAHGESGTLLVVVTWHPLQGCGRDNLGVEIRGCLLEIVCFFDLPFSIQRLDCVRWFPCAGMSQGTVSPKRRAR
jgi:hypothetical protein